MRKERFFTSKIVTTPPSSCTWREDDDGNWITDCNNIFILIDGTPHENKMKFCVYCGKMLVEGRDTP